MDATSEPGRTAWGDTQGRRRDILTSAEHLLQESGYAALTMRGVAAGAGVSAGTVYQYFSGKEEVFVALTAQRLDRIEESLANVDRTMGIAAVLREILPLITELWSRLGRSAAQWEAKALAEGRRSKDAMVSITDYRRVLRQLDQTLREVAGEHGQTVIDDPIMPHWVWDALIGTADDLLLGGSQQERITRGRIVEFATDAIERSIVVG